MAACPKCVLNIEFKYNSGAETFPEMAKGKNEKEADHHHDDAASYRLKQTGRGSMPLCFLFPGSLNE